MLTHITSAVSPVVIPCMASHIQLLTELIGNVVFSYELKNQSPLRRTHFYTIFFLLGYINVASLEV